MNATLPPSSSTAPFAVIPGNAQQLGNRAEQQDSFGFSDLADPALLARCGALAVVADGMGGHALGRDASQRAKQVLLTEYPAKPAEEPIPDALLRVLQQANEAVRSLAHNGGQVDNAGTTLAAAVIHRNQLYWISVGDSRIYLCRRGQLSLLTSDHVYARELEQDVAQGRLSTAEASQHPDRGALTSYLGIPELTEVDRNLRPYPLQVGDRILLCTDGLYRGLGEAEIAEELTRADPQTAAEALVARVLAKCHAHQDNVTAVTLACTDSAAMPHVQTPPARYRLSLRGLTSGVLLIGLGVIVGLLLSRYSDRLPWPVTSTVEPPPANDIQKSQGEKADSPTVLLPDEEESPAGAQPEPDGGPPPAAGPAGAQANLPTDGVEVQPPPQTSTLPPSEEMPGDTANTGPPQKSDTTRLGGETAPIPDPLRESTAPPKESSSAERADQPPEPIPPVGHDQQNPEP